tara:strand:+ start:1455 stop:2639 length:1185 start_codon:yes stop_codon:yes gene_type:complete
MSVPAVGEFYNGGYVFHVDTVNTLAYIAGQSIINEIVFSKTPILTSISTNTTIASSTSNTNNLGLSINASNLVLNSIEQNFDDWILPSKDALDLIIEIFSPSIPSPSSPYFGANDHLNIGTIEGQPFWSSSFQGNNSLNRNVLVSRANNLSTTFSSTNVFAKVIAIRVANYSNATVNITDADGTSVSTNGFIPFGKVVNQFVSDPDDATPNFVTQNINIEGNPRQPISVSFFIDMTKLAPGFSATPSSIFGSITNLASVQIIDSSEIYYVDDSSSLLTSDLTAVQNNKVYLLTFNGLCSETLNIRGEVLSSTRVTISVQSGENWVPVPMNDIYNLEDNTFFTQEMQSKTTKIIDISTGEFWPGSRNNPFPLAAMVAGRGYYFQTTGSYNLIFTK